MYIFLLRMLNITFRKYHVKKKKPVVKVALLKNPSLAPPGESLPSAGEEAAVKHGLIDSLLGEDSRSIAGRNCRPQIRLGPAIRGPAGFAVAAAAGKSFLLLLLLQLPAAVNFITAAGFRRSGRPPRMAVAPLVNTRDSIGSDEREGNGSDL